MVSLINIENSLDDNNLPIGHEFKMLEDLPQVFEEKIEILAGKEYIQRLDRKKNKITLPFSIHSDNYTAMNLKILCNYFVSLIGARGNVLIYVDTPEALLWGVALFKGKRKIVSITYLHWDKYIEKYILHDAIRCFLVRRGLRRLDGCIVTNRMYRPEGSYIRVADYYITDKLKRYQKKEKINGCVCLGEIRPEKDIEGLVKIVRKTSLYLLIAGVFRDKEIYRKIKVLQTDNIKIQNRNLPYETYMEYLSSYKYIVLPYDKKYYSLKTSGILLEGIFLGAVPIAPESLLKQNQIQGLGYSDISEIPGLIRLYEKGKIVVQNDLEKYQFDRYKEKILQFINWVNCSV